MIIKERLDGSWLAEAEYAGRLFVAEGDTQGEAFEAWIEMVAEQGKPNNE